MGFLGKLGININLLFAQIINFGLLLWLLKRFLYKPILKQIEDNEKELTEAQIIKEKLEKEKILFAQQKKEERKQTGQIIAEAGEVAQKIKDTARNEAEKEKKAVIQQIHLRLKEIENDEGK